MSGITCNRKECSDNLEGIVRRLRATEERVEDKRKDLSKANERIKELEASLSDCASKLESQLVRNPQLPETYKEIVSDAFALLRTK